MEIKTVWIGGIPYSVQVRDGLISQDGTAVLWGEIIHSKQIINIDATQEPEHQVVTLLHEIMHGLLTQAGIKEHSEQILETLSYGLVAVLFSNPELRELLIANAERRLYYNQFKDLDIKTQKWTASSARDGSKDIRDISDMGIDWQTCREKMGILTGENTGE